MGLRRFRFCAQFRSLRLRRCIAIAPAPQSPLLKLQMTF
jgi:hypothetical protein